MVPKLIIYSKENKLAHQAIGREINLCQPSCMECFMLHFIPIIDEYQPLLMYKPHPFYASVSYYEDCDENDFVNHIFLKKVDAFN